MADYKPHKFELTWIGKDEQPGIERLLKSEGKDAKRESGNALFYN